MDLKTMDSTVVSWCSVFVLTTHETLHPTCAVHSAPRELPLRHVDSWEGPEKQLVAEP